jgi:outer membrane protein assembly factor BamB
MHELRVDIRPWEVDVRQSHPVVTAVCRSTCPLGERPVRRPDRQQARVSEMLPWKTLNRTTLLPGAMNGNRSRRAFLGAAGAGFAAFAGCTAPTSPDDERSGTRATATESDADTQSTTTAGSKSVSLPKGESWPTFGGDAANTGRRGTGPGPSAPAASAWRTDVDGIYTMPGPVVADGAVYVGSGESAYGADAATGDTRWSVDLGGLTHYFSPSVTSDGVLFAAQSNITGGKPGTLTSLSPAGERRWEREFAITSSPSELDGTVYVGTSQTDGAQVHALSDADGSDQWTASLDATRIRGAPAIAEGVLYVSATDVSSDTGLVAALDAADGSELWTRTFDVGTQAAPAVRDGVLYIQANDGRLFALDTGAGETNWTARLGTQAKTTPALGEAHLVGMVENQLVGVSLTKGKVSWKTDIGYTLINGVSVAGDRAYVGGSRLTAVDVETGEMAWDKPVPGAAGGFGAPVVVGNTLFVGVCIKHEANDPYDDYLYAYV